ncbi:hypothetical protein [Rhodoferax saidenbachensis]|uniref:MarR family transcriptional regulator n=1 Tax=Rhodoferax saidenbachensis TaxID=1484693 RepID=A0ABU1ZT41_9BURK|nr:hypothetical protein [Rhodoferax saidenbachensis]MDR7308727.1 hypothetical protein [Rhodoferax saidenbachensis]
MLTELQQTLLWTLYRAAKPVSLPWLGKQLGLSGSVVMRSLAGLGEAAVAGQAGPGWVHVEMADSRWTASLTEAGRVLCAEQDHAP